MAPTSKSVTLTFGYMGPQGGEAQKSVVIGRRVTGGDLMKIGDEPESQGNTQFQLMMLQAAITSFGTLTMPVPLTVLLSLLRPDRDELWDAYADFLKETGAGRRVERLSSSKLRLQFGFKSGETVFDVVEFGKLLTGYEELAGDDYEGTRRACFIMGREITSLSQSEGAATMSGPVSVELFETVDGEDLKELKAFEDNWLDSFRRKRETLQKDDSAPGSVPDAAHGDVGAGGAES